MKKVALAALFGLLLAPLVAFACDPPPNQQRFPPQVRTVTMIRVVQPQVQHFNMLVPAPVQYAPVQQSQPQVVSQSQPFLWTNGDGTTEWRVNETDSTGFTYQRTIQRNAAAPQPQQVQYVPQAQYAPAPQVQYVQPVRQQQFQYAPQAPPRSTNVNVGIFRSSQAPMPVRGGAAACTS